MGEAVANAGVCGGVCKKKKEATCGENSLSYTHTLGSSKGGGGGGGGSVLMS
jgi:hypothetical protein